jgi:NifU-like protein involved in Fe-S cluster formation
MSGPNPEVRRRVIAPRFGGALPTGSWRRLQGLANAVACADVCRLQLGIDDGGAIVVARHLTYGCPPAIAAAEWLCELLEGRPLRLAQQLRPEDVMAGLCLVAAEDHAAQLVLDALGAALAG